MMAAGHIHHVYRNSQPVLGFADAAAQHVLHAEALAEDAHVIVGLEIEGGRARDHLQLLDARQGVDQLLGDPIAKVPLIA
jgi:hypothetical protein